MVLNNIIMTAETPFFLFNYAFILILILEFLSKYILKDHIFKYLNCIYHLKNPVGIKAYFFSNENGVFFCKL